LGCRSHDATVHLQPPLTHGRAQLTALTLLACWPCVVLLEPRPLRVHVQCLAVVYMLQCCVTQETRRDGLTAADPSHVTHSCREACRPGYCSVILKLVLSQALNVWIALIERRNAWAGVRSSADSTLSTALATAEADAALETAAINGVAAHIDSLAALLTVEGAPSEHACQARVMFDMSLATPLRWFVSCVWLMCFHSRFDGLLA